MEDLVKNIPAPLQRNMSSELLEYFFDEDVCEIMQNPDGRLFIEKSDGSIECKKGMDHKDAYRFCLTAASLFTDGFSQGKPVISCAFDFMNARFEAVLPPLTTKPAFCIRRHSRCCPDLEGLQKKAFISGSQIDFLISALKKRRSLIICGETGSGKTTLLCALLQTLKTISPDERVITIEDTPEIKSDLNNCLPLYSNEHLGSDELVRSCLRLRPDRIVMGEIRGPEALDMLDAFSSGHEGSMATLHAGNPQQALNRLCLLVSRHPRAPRRIESMVAQSSDLLIQLHVKPARHIAALYEVKGFVDHEFLISTLNV